MGTYHPLTEYQRYQIYVLRKAGHDQQTIATTIEGSPSTISRELRRHRGQRGYRPHQAHQKALVRRRQKAQVTKMRPALVERIEADLRQEWSPEQIAGRLEAAEGLRLSAERILPTHSGRSSVGRYVVSPSAPPPEETQETLWQTGCPRAD